MWWRRKNRVRCEDVDRLMERVLAGEAGAWQTAVYTHLQSCPHCQTRWTAEQQRLSQFKQLAERPFFTLSSTESAQIRTAVWRHVRRRKHMRQVSSIFRSATTMAALFVVVVIGFMVWQRQRVQVETAVPPSEITTITFGAFESQRNSYQRRIDDFNDAHPAIRVQFVPLDDVSITADGTRYDRREIASLADTAVLLPPTNAAEAGFFLDLEPLIDTDPAFNAADFWPGVLDGCRRGDRLIGVPTQISFNYIFYDGAAFDAAGLPRPQPGWTWPQFADAAMALTQRDGDRTLRYGFVPRPGDALLSSLTDPLLPGAEGTLNIDQLVGATEWYVQLYEAGAVPNLSDSDDVWQTTEQLIELGEAAMWVDYEPNLVMRQQTLGDDVGAVPFPVSSDNTATTPATAGCMSASVGTAHPQAVWQWLTFLTRHPVTGSSRAIPARQSVALAIPLWQAALDAPDSPLAYAVNHAWYGQRNPTGLNVVVEAIEDAAVSDTAVDEAIAAIGTLPPQETAVPASQPIVVATPAPTAVPEDVRGKTAVIFPPFRVAGVTPDQFEREFEALHPDIDLVIDSSSFEDNQTITVTDETLARDFDCYASNNYFLHRNGRDDRFYDLEPLLAADDSLSIDMFHPSLIESLRTDGHLYMLPTDISPAVLYYQPTKFSLLDLPEPSADMSVEDLLALAATAVATSENELKGWTPTNEFWAGSAASIYYLLQSQNINILTSGTPLPQARLNHTETIRGVEWLLAQAEAGSLYFPFQTGPGMGPRWRAVVQGQSIMWSAALTDFDPTRGTSLQKKFIPLPAIPNQAVPFTVNGFSISRRTPDPQPCWQWIRFLLEKVEENGGTVPARASVMASPAWETAVGAETAALYRTIAERTFPVQTNWLETLIATEVYKWFDHALRAIQDGANITDALDEAQRAADVYISCMSAFPAPGLTESQECSAEIGASWLLPQE